MTDQGTPTVLVVDDEADLVELYAAFLAPEYDVRTATSGEAALAQADDDVDVALLDRRMPEMSGDDLLAKLRERGLDFQVAMLTGIEPDGDIIDMPFDDYKIKPIERSDLVGLVRVLLERADFDETSRQFFRLASKKAAMEVAGNDGTAEYEEILERMESVRSDIDESLDSVLEKAGSSDLSAEV